MKFDKDNECEVSVVDRMSACMSYHNAEVILLNCGSK